MEEDSLESEGKRKRGADASDPDTMKSYDPGMKTNHYESKGAFSLVLVGQRRILRRAKRTVSHLELPDATKSSLLAFINHS